MSTANITRLNQALERLASEFVRGLDKTAMAIMARDGVPASFNDWAWAERVGVKADAQKDMLRAAMQRVAKSLLKGGSSVDFIAALQARLHIGDRQVRIRGEDFRGQHDAVYVNFINLPSGIGGAGGGAEAENNRMSFWINGFDKKDRAAPAPTGKVKVELANSALPRSYMLRAKSGSPDAIATYLADFLNKVAAEVPPKFTHTQMA